MSEQGLHSLIDESDDNLLKKLLTDTILPGHRTYEAAKQVLESRTSERQTRAVEMQAQAARATATTARLQVEAARSLTVLTRRLVWATWGLVLSTLLLALIGGFQVWIQAAKPGTGTSPSISSPSTLPKSH